MKLLRPSFAILACAGVLACESAAALPPVTGAGATRCTEVIRRVSGQKVAERMAVLSWVQGYLFGLASAQSPLVPGGATAQLPEYDELAPRVIVLCQADPASDLSHVATQFFAGLPRSP